MRSGMKENNNKEDSSNAGSEVRYLLASPVGCNISAEASEDSQLRVE